MRRNIISTLVSQAFRGFSGSFRDRPGNAAATPRRRRTLAFESLESRLLLSADPVAVVDGTIVITGTEGNDTVVVQEVERSTISVQWNDLTFNFASSGITNIHAVLGLGDDAMTVGHTLSATIDGGEGENEVIITTGPAAERVDVRSGAGPDSLAIVVTDLATGKPTASLEVTGVGGVTVNAGGDDEFALDNRDGGLGRQFLRFKFETVFTTKIDWSGPGDQGSEENISFVFGKLGIAFVEQDDSGGRAGGPPTAYDVGGGTESGSVDVRVSAPDKSTFHLESTALESLTIKAGDGDDEFNVHGLVAAALHLFGEGGSDTVTHKLQGRAKFDNIDLGEGDDRFQFVATDAAELIQVLGVPHREVPDPLIRVTDLATGKVTAELLIAGAESIGVDAARGNDQVAMSDAGGPLAGIEFAIELGEGDDSLDAAIHSTLPSDLPASDTIIYVIDISGSMGRDTVTFTGLDANPTADSFFDVFVDLGEGDNLFTADLMNPAGLLSVVGGAGNDKVTARAHWSDAAPDQVIDFSALFESGAGNDRIEVHSLMEEEGIFYGLGLDGGDGDDSMQLFFQGKLKVSGDPLTAPRVKASLDGGNGNDSVGLGAEGTFQELSASIALGGGMDTSSLDVLRWLGQLAVNIVDFIDEDEIATPFSATIAALVENGTLDLTAHSEFILPRVPGERAGIDFGLNAHAMAPQSSLDLSVMGTDAADVVTLHLAEIADVAAKINAGDGNDSTRIESLIGDQPSDRSYQIDAGEGDNKTLIVFGDGEHGQRPPVGGSHIRTEYRSGAGNDTLAVDWLASAHVFVWNSSLDLGGGADTVQLRVEPGTAVDAFGVEVKVTGGEDTGGGPSSRIVLAEADTGQALGDVQVSGGEKVRLGTGAGNDRIVFDDVTGSLRQTRFDINAGAGDDEFKYVPVGRVARYIEGSLEEGLQWTVFDGEEGKDRFTVATSERAELIEISGLMVRDVPDPLVRVTDKARNLVTLQASVVGTEVLTADAGGGDDSVMTSDAEGPLAGIEMSIDTGDGNDALVSSFFDLFGNLKLMVQTGDGNDVVELNADGSFEELSATIATGEGDDAIRHRLFAIVDRTNLNIDAGEGDNRTELRFGDGEHGQVPPAGQSKIIAEYRSGAGNDTLTVDWLAHPERDLSADLSAATGAGDDQVIASWDHQHEFRPGKIANWDHRFELGDGNDAFNGVLGDPSSGLPGRLELEISGGGGSDAIGLLVPAVQKVREAAARVRVDGGSFLSGLHNDLGASLDELSVATGDDPTITNVFFRSVSGLTGEMELVEYRVGIGSPADETAVAQIDIARLEELNVTTGGGDDQILIGLDQPTASLPALNFNTGAGNDTVEVKTSGGTGSGPQVKVFDGETGAETHSFLAYAPTFSGGVRVAAGDVNGDGVADIITGAGPGAGPHVKVFDGLTNAEIRSFFAYAPAFSGGVFVAAGDINGDGKDDIITGADAGGGPHVKVFSGATGAELHSFFAYASMFTGGVRVAAGDVNGDGVSDIITGAGPGAGPHVKVFDGKSLAEIRSFFAYAPAFAGGVFVAAGDVDGDGRADIVTGAGPGAGPHVKVFSGASGAELHSFFAYAPTLTGGVRVAAGDVNGDRVADIITGAGPGAGPHVKAFDGKSLAELQSFFAHAPAFTGGVFVAAGDINGDGMDDIVTGADRQTTFKLTVDTAGGDDRVATSFFDVFAVQDVSIDLGDGTDLADVRLGHAGAELPPVARNIVGIDAGAGDDTIRFEADGVNLAAGGEAEWSLSGGAGNDAVHMRVSNPAPAEGGEEPEQVEQAGRRVSASLRTGAGNDRADVKFSPRGADIASLDLDMGTGADNVALDWRGDLKDPGPIQASVLIDLGGADPFLPAAGDEVLVAFEHGDVTQPFVLGVLWNSQDVPPPDDGTPDPKSLRLEFVKDADPEVPASLELEISGGAGNDAIGLLVPAVQKVRVAARVDGGAGEDTINVSVVPPLDTPAGMIELDISGGDGADRISVVGDGNSRITGGNGADWITVVGDGDNVINGGNGADWIVLVGNGDNVINGGNGNDWITVIGNGNNVIDGGHGNDRIIVVGNGGDISFGPVTGLALDAILTSSGAVRMIPEGMRPGRKDLCMTVGRDGWLTVPGPEPTAGR